MRPTPLARMYVARLVLLEHELVAAHDVAGVAPVADRVEVAERELVLQAELDRRGAARDLARQEALGPARRLVVVGDRARRVQAVLVAQHVDEPVRGELRDAVRRARAHRRVARSAATRRGAEDLAGARDEHAHAVAGLVRGLQQRAGRARRRAPSCRPGPSTRRARTSARRGGRARRAPSRAPRRAATRGRRGRRGRSRTPAIGASGADHADDLVASLAAAARRGTSRPVR